MRSRRGNGCATGESANWPRLEGGGTRRLPSGACDVPAALGKKEGPVTGPSTRAEPASYDFVAGWTPGLSLKNCLLISMYCFH